MTTKTTESPEITVAKTMLKYNFLRQEMERIAKNSNNWTSVKVLQRFAQEALDATN